MLKSNKKLLIISILLILSLMVSVSYAYYVNNTTQENNNLAMSDCFKLTFSDSNSISLQSAYPMNEVDASDLVPYEFTIKNVCKTSAQYEVNLEKLNNSTLNDYYLRLKLDDNISFLFGDRNEVANHFNENVSISRNIASGILGKNEERTYHLRMWLDENSTIDAANKIFESKVVINSTINVTRTLNFDSNGGDFTLSSLMVKSGKKFEFPMSAPFRNGYILLGWSEDSDAAIPTYYPGEEYVIEDDKTLYAVWTDKIYLYNRGDECEKLTGGWTYYQNEMNGRGEKQEDNLFLYRETDNGVSSSDFRTKALNIPDGDYSIHFNYNKIRVRSNDIWDAIYFRVGSGNNVTSSNYVVGEYSDDSFDTSIYRGDILTVGNYNGFDHIYEIYLVPKVYENPRVIAYDLNGGINGPSLGTYPHESNTITISEKIPYKNGYTFLGYSTNKADTTASYFPGNSYTFTSDTTLYAIYRANNYINSYKLKDYMVALTENSSTSSLDEIGFSGLAYDDYENLRYVGKNPKNYLYYNCDDYSNQSADTCELWRIIGRFGDNIKIIRDEAIGTYTWEASSDDINNNKGVNEWSVSELKNNLNGAYYNSTEGYCTDYGRQIDCDFSQSSSTPGLKNDDTRNMIDTITWPTAAINGENPSGANSFNAAQTYMKERGTYHGKQCTYGAKCNDTVERNTSWDGKIGLITPSDYQYAVGGGHRSTCLTKEGYYYDECKDYDWLYYQIIQWTMIPAADEVEAGYVYYITADGKVLSLVDGWSNRQFIVRPVLALKNNIQIKDDVVSDGSISNPYQLKVN